MAKIDTSGWKEFRIVDIFDVKNTHSILQHSVKEAGRTPYVTASYENNLVVAYVDYDESQIERGRCIFIGGKTLVVSYQECDFYSNDSHNLVLYPKSDIPLERNEALFLVAVIQKTLGRQYSWGNSISYKAIQKDVILLPATESGEPDTTFMKSYVERLLVKTRENIENLKAIAGLQG